MLSALRNVPDSLSMSSMNEYIDPNLMDLYPHDCLFKVTVSKVSDPTIKCWPGTNNHCTGSSRVKNTEPTFFFV